MFICKRNQQALYSGRARTRDRVLHPSCSTVPFCTVYHAYICGDDLPFQRALVCVAPLAAFHGACIWPELSISIPTLLLVTFDAPNQLPFSPALFLSLSRCKARTFQPSLILHLSLPSTCARSRPFLWWGEHRRPGVSKSSCFLNAEYSYSVHPAPHVPKVSASRCGILLELPRVWIDCFSTVALVGFVALVNVGETCRAKTKRSCHEDYIYSCRSCCCSQLL